MNSLKNFSKITAAFGVCLFATIFLSACTAPPATPPPTVFKPTPAPVKPTPPLVASSHGSAAANDDQVLRDLSWRLINGKQKTFSDYRGKAIILDFWATYCPPCEEEIPHLVELSNKYPRDLQVVGLHVGGDEDKFKIADFVTKYRMSYDLGFPEQDLTDFYIQGDDRIPQTFVFNRQGKLIQKFVGFTPDIKAALDKTVQIALAQ